MKKGAEPFGKTVKQLNALIGQYAALLATRKAKGSTNGEGELPDAEETAGE